MNRENWQVKKLGEVCLIQRGGSPRPINEYITDSEKGLNWIKIGDTTPNSRYITKTAEKIKPEGLSKTRLVHRGDFLLSNSMSFGRPYILGIDGCIHDGWLVIHDEKKVFDKNFLYYLLSSSVIKSKFELLAVGGVVNNLNSKMVRNLEIPIPPLPIQEAIVKELDTLHRLKELQEQQLTEYDNLAQCTFYSMFGDPIENDRDWEVRKMGEVCEITNGRNQKKVEDPKGIYPIMGSGGIMGYANEFLCPKDTVIIGRKGTINKPFIVKEKVWIVDTAFGFVANNSLLNSHFLNYFCKSFDFNRLNVAVTIPSLRKIDLKEIPIPIPPLSLQSQFAERINKIEELKQLVKQSISQTQMLIDYTMDKYFN